MAKPLKGQKAEHQTSLAEELWGQVGLLKSGKFMGST